MSVAAECEDHQEQGPKNDTRSEVPTRETPIGDLSKTAPRRRRYHPHCDAEQDRTASRLGRRR
jgi:hypothetical protein